MLAPPQSGSFHASSSPTIPPLHPLTEADFAIFPKLKHEELKKPTRRYGAGIAPEYKAKFVEIGDDDDSSSSGLELSIIEEYLPEGEVEEEEEEEDLEVDLPGVYVVDE